MTARLWLLVLIQFVSMGAMEMSNPFWPLHLRGLLQGQATALAAVSLGVYVLPMLGMAATSAWWGRMGDRHGHKPMMVRALAGLALTQLALSTADSAAQVLAWRFVQGALAGFIAPAQAWGTRMLGAGSQPYTLFATLQTATNVGSLLGATAGGALWQWLPFASLNRLAALLCAACALVVALALPAEPRASAHTAAAAPSPSPLLPGQHWRPLAVALIGVLALLLAARMVAHMPLSLYADAVLGLPRLHIGLSYGAMALGFALTAWVWARRAQGLDLARSLRMQLAVTALLALLVLALGQQRSLAGFVTGQLLWGALIAGSTPVLSALLARAVEPAQRGQWLGRNQGAMQIGSAAGMGLGSLAIHGGWLPQVYSWAAGGYLLALVLLAVLLWRSSQAAGATR